MDKENVVYTYDGLLFNLKKEGNPAVYSNVDGPGGCYAKLNMPNTERQILCDSIYMRHLK